MRKFKRGQLVMVKKDYMSLPDVTSCGHVSGFEGYIGRVVDVGRNYEIEGTRRTYFAPNWLVPVAETPEELELLLIKGEIDYETYKELSTSG